MSKFSPLYKYWTTTHARQKVDFDVDQLVSSTNALSLNQSEASYLNQTEWIHLYTVGSNNSVLAKTPNSVRTEFNIRNNIAHISIGEQYGILKNVSFSRTQIPGKLEAALESSKDRSEKNLLFQNKYDASIEIFGNPVFKPGMLIWLDPRALGLGSIDTYGRIRYGNAFRYELGIGGYYRVVNVSNELSSGLYVTKIQTVAELDLKDIHREKSKENKRGT